MSNVELFSTALGLGLLLPALWILSRPAEGQPRRSLRWRVGIALAALPWFAAIYMVGFGSARDVSAASDAQQTPAAPWPVESLPHGVQLQGRWVQPEVGHGFRFELLGSGRYRVLETSSSGQLLTRGKAFLDGSTLGIEMDRLPRHWDGALLHAAQPSWTARLFLDRMSITGETAMPAVLPGDAESGEPGELGESGEGGGREIVLRRVD